MRYFLLPALFALLPYSLAQNPLQLTQLAQKQRELWTQAIEENHSYLSNLSIANQFFSVDDFLDAMNDHRGDSLSPDCYEDMHTLISARKGSFEYPEFAQKVYLPMRDSSGKIHLAILKWHIYFAGHFSECVSIDEKLTGRERPFKADYFKVTIDFLFRSNARNDSCTIIPLVHDITTVLGWSVGVCLPASCSSAELESLVISEEAKHNPICTIARTNDSIEDIGVGFYVTVSIFGVVFALCVLSGIADFFFSEMLSDKPLGRSLSWRLFMSFSLYTNIASIFEISGGKKDGQIEPIHCIRFFSMCWVVLGHLFGEIFFFIANPLDMVDLTKDLTTEFITNAFFSVDSFFFIGGLLLTFLWFKNYHRNPKQTNSIGAWAMFYIHRILRLSPPYFMAVIFYAFVLNWMLRDSPFNLNATTQVQTDMCKNTWWISFTYLQNFIQNDRQCFPVSWYLAADTQIFFFTPLLILPLAFKPIIGFAVAAVVLFISTGLNIFLVFHYHWPATGQFVGATDPERTDFDDYNLYMYTSPITRCQVYIIGMLVGWFLQTKKRMRINPIINIALWILSLALMLTLILGLHSQTTGDLIPVFWRAMYSAFSKPAWALALSWIIISCYYGYGGPINSFMSWHVWVPLGRLSYCCYLVHFPILFLVIAQSHDEFYFSSFIDLAITRLIPIIGLTYFVSIFWSACFEISFGKMEMLLLGGHRMRVKTTEEAPIQRKPSKVEADDVEDAAHIKIKL